MLRDNPQVGDTNNIDTVAAAAAAAASIAPAPANDSNAHLEESPATIYQYQNCILEFTMGIDPLTSQPTYALRAVPYIDNQNPFSNLNKNAECINNGDNDGHQKQFFELFNANNGQNILALIKMINQREHLQIKNAIYVPEYCGAIRGDLAEEYVSEGYRNFGKGQYHNLKCFLSYIDLVIRNKLDVNTDQLDVQLAYQKQTYGIELDVVERLKLLILLKTHPGCKMQSDLHVYLAEKNAKKQEKSGNTSLSFFNSLTTFVSGTSSSSSALSSSPALEQERLSVVARLRVDKYASVSAQKQDLKRLFALRPYFRPDDLYCHRRTMMNKRIAQFWMSIDKAERWQDADVMKQARELMIEAMLMSDEILARMENFLRQVGEQPTARNMAKLLANQKLSFCRTFIYSGIIDFYPKCREKGWFESKIVLSGARRSEFRMFEEFETNESFFMNGSPENALRKLYNTFIEYGFNQPYGGDFRKELVAADGRFVMWSSKDSKVQEPIPETWPQFIQRSLSGEAQATQESYTYSHPINSSRPT